MSNAWVICYSSQVVGNLLCGQQWHQEEQHIAIIQRGEVQNEMIKEPAKGVGAGNDVQELVFPLRTWLIWLPAHGRCDPRLIWNKIWTRSGLMCSALMRRKGSLRLSCAPRPITYGCCQWLLGGWVVHLCLAWLVFGKVPLQHWE